MFRILVFFIFTSINSSVFSADVFPFKDKPINKKTVVIGTYLKQIYGFSLVEQKFEADFYIWFRWKGDDYNPMDHFILENGTIRSKEDSFLEQKKDGSFYGYIRVIATFNQRFDISDFPFDNHNLDIAIEEENENNLVEYIIDKDNSKFDTEIFFPGYKISKFSMDTSITSYNTNYGDLDLITGNTSSYSRASFKMNIYREGATYFIKLMIGVIISTLIAMMTFFIKPIHVDPRFGLCVGGLFGVIASEFVILSSLPPMSVMTIADMIHILSLIFVIICIILSIISLRLYDKKETTRYKKLDLYSSILLIPLYFIFIGIIILTNNI